MGSTAATFRVVVVGAGDASVLCDGTKTVVIDGGTSGKADRLAEALQGVPKPELVVISHPDSDHRGGVLALLERKSDEDPVWDDTDPLLVVKNTALPGTKDDGEVATLKRLGFTQIDTTATPPPQPDTSFVWNVGPPIDYNMFRRGTLTTPATPAGTGHGPIWLAARVPQPMMVLAEWDSWKADWDNDESPFNSASVLHVHKSTGMLLTGDSLATAIQTYKGGLPNTVPINMLKVPHHGSRRNCIDRQDFDWNDVSREYLMLHLLQLNSKKAAKEPPIDPTKIDWADQVQPLLEKVILAASLKVADVTTGLSTRVTQYKAQCQRGMQPGMPLPDANGVQLAALWSALVTEAQSTASGKKRNQLVKSCDEFVAFANQRDLSNVAEDLVLNYYPQKMAAFFKQTGAHNFTVSASGTKHGHPNEEVVIGLLIAALDWSGANAANTARHIFFTVVKDADKNRRQRIKSGIQALAGIKTVGDPSKTYGDVFIERIGKPNETRVYITQDSTTFVEVDPKATAPNGFIKTPADVIQVDCKKLLDAAAPQLNALVAVSGPAFVKPKPTAFRHISSLAQPASVQPLLLGAVVPSDGTPQELSLLEYLQQFWPAAAPPAGGSVALLVALGCCTQGQSRALAFTSKMPRVLQADRVYQAPADLQASRVTVVKHDDGSFDVLSAKLVLPPTLSVTSEAAIAIPAFTLNGLELVLTWNHALEVLNLTATATGTVAGLVRTFAVDIGQPLVADGALQRAHEMAGAAKIKFSQPSMDWAALDVAFKGMFKGALGKQTGEMPAIVGGIASLSSGGFELEEVALGTRLAISRVFGNVDASQLGTTFDWSKVLPGDLGSAMGAKVQVQGGTVELSVYSPAYLQVIGVSLDNFVFTAPSGAAISISLHRQPIFVNTATPPTLDWLFSALPVAGSDKPVTLEDFAELLGPVGVATSKIPGVDAVLKDVQVKQLYIELEQIKGAPKLQGVSVQASVAPAEIIPGILALTDSFDISLTWERGLNGQGAWSGGAQTVMRLFNAVDLAVELDLPTPYTYGGFAVSNPHRGANSTPALSLQAVSKALGWAVPSFGELDLNKYLPLEVSRAEITLDVNDSGKIVVAGVEATLHVGDIKLEPFELREAQITIADWLEMPPGQSGARAQLSAVVGAGSSNVCIDLTYNATPSAPPTPMTPPTLKPMIASNGGVLPFPKVDPASTYRFAGDVTVMRTEQPDAVPLPAATQQLGLAVDPSDQLLHGSPLAAFKPFAGSIGFDSTERWAMSLTMAERIPLGDSAQLLGLQAVVKKQPEGVQFGVRGAMSIGAWQVNVSAAYSKPTNLIEFDVSASQGFAVLGAFSGSLGSVYGLTVPAPGQSGNSQPSGLSSAGVELSTDLQFSLRRLAVHVEGRWTVGQIAGRIGLPWPLADDFVTLEGAALCYIPSDYQPVGGGDKLTSQFAVAATMEIPALKASKLTAALVVQGSASTAIKVSGSWQPIDGVELLDASLAVVKGTGLVLATDGKLFGIPFNVSITAKDKGGMDFLAHAANVNVGSILKKLIPDIPSFLADFCGNLAFAQVNVGYVNSAFTLVATPDVSKSPELSAILKVTGFSQDDIHLATGSAGTSFSIVKSLDLNLGKPFDGPASLHFGMTVSDRVPGSIMFSAGFAAGIDVFGQGVLRFDLTAGVYVPELWIYVKGQTTAPFALKDFPFVALDALYLDATIDPKVEPPVLEALSFHCATQILGATTNTVIKYDAASAQFALLSDIEHADLQKALASVGVNVDLGPFDLVLQQAKMSFAEQQVVVDKVTIPQGLFFAGAVSLFGLINTSVNLQLAPTGVEFDLHFDATELAKLDKMVADEVQKALDDAANKIQGAKSDAAKKLQDAQATLADAQKAVDGAQSAFDDAKKQAAEKLASAQSAVDSAQAAFNDAQQRANSALAKAQDDVNSAQAAFDAAKRDADDKLRSAQAAVDSANAAFENAKRDADSKLQSAQDAVDSINGEIDDAKDNPLKWGELPGLYVALGVAKGVLKGAQEIVDAVLSGSQAVALSSAREALDLANQAAQAVLTGSEAVALNTAKGVLEGAQQAAQAVLTGSEFAALQSAKAALDLAQNAANAVLTGSEAVALQTAQGALELAKQTVAGVEQATTATLQLCADATRDLGHVVSLALTLFALLKLDLHFQLTKSLLAISASASVAVEGKALPDLSFSLEIKDPLTKLVKELANGVVAGVKSAYNTLDDFL